MKKLLLPLTLILSSCSPFIGYTHFDTLPLRNDGQAYDLICGGVNIHKHLTYKMSACSNVASNGGEFLKIEVEYEFNRVIL